MPVTHILVEGKDDLVFIRRLIDIMRADLPVLEWKLLPPGQDTITVGASRQYLSCTDKRRAFHHSVCTLPTAFCQSSIPPLCISFGFSFL